MTLADPRAAHAAAERPFWILLAAALLIGTGLRFFKLDAGNFWLDELYTIRSASNLARGEWQWTKVLGYVPTELGLEAAGVDAESLDPDDPSGWKAAGVDEWTARLPTAVMGILTIPLLALASRPVLGNRAAGLLAVLLAVSPWHLYWSQAARFYIPQFLFYNLSLALYFGATRPLRPARFAAAMACFVIAFMCQPTSLILGLVFAADWAAGLVRRRPVRLGLSGWSAVLVAAGACAALAVADRVTGRATLHQALTNEMMQSPAGVIAAAAYLIWPTVAVLAALSGVWLWSRRPRLALYLGAGAVIPIALFAALSAVAPVGSRYTFVALYCWLALAAVGADRAWRVLLPRAGPALAAAPAAMLLTASMVSCAIYFNSGGNFHARWGDAAKALRAMRQPGEPVFADHPGPAYITAYYLGEPIRDLPRSTAAVAEIPGTSWYLIEHNKPTPSARFWLMEGAELIDYFPLRAIHTNSAVQIYRHRGRETGV